jgi:hypothetical protein
MLPKSVFFSQDESSLLAKGRMKIRPYASKIIIEINQVQKPKPKKSSHREDLDGKKNLNPALIRIQIIIPSLFGNQLIMRSLLGNLASFDYQNLISLANGT